MSSNKKIELVDDISEAESHQNEATTQCSNNDHSPLKFHMDESDFDAFPESLYEAIEDFLDAEGLFMDTKFPTLTHTILKPSVDIKLVKSFGIKRFNSAAIDENINSKAIPGFLARRTLSLLLKDDNNNNSAEEL